MATFHRRGHPGTLLVGFLEAQTGLGEVAIRRRKPTWLETRLDFDGKTLPSGSVLEGEPLRIDWDNDATELIDTWTRDVGHRMKARVPTGKIPSGWCSWYYYYNKVTEENIRTNLDALATQRERLPVRYVQLDDGYQTFVGDWLSLNEKFPSGLASLADRIRNKGFLPGIWTAPFFVQRESGIFRHHQDWLLKDLRGKPRWMGYRPT